MQANDNGENDGPPGTGVCSQFFSEDVRSTTDFVRDQIHREDRSCTTTQAFNNTTGSPPAKAQWHDVSLNDGQSQSSDTGCPDTYENMITRMLDIEKSLTAIKETVTKASVRCHLLNVDVVTMFSPEMVDALNKTVEQCEKCIKTMETSPPEDS